MKSTSTSKDFIIKFKGLSAGLHKFDYVLDNVFFQEIDAEEIRDGKANLQVLLQKEDTLLTFDISIEGSILVMCDRCLDDLNLPIKSQERLYVKFGKNVDSEDDNIVFLSEEEYQIDLFDYIRQYILIHLPMQRIHPDDENGNSTCNPDMLARIRALANMQEDIKEKTDPRWDKLKEIHTNLKKI